MKFSLYRTPRGFLPVTEEDQKKLSKVEMGETIDCRAIDERDVIKHRKFFAMLNIAFHNLPERYENNFPTIEDLREELIKRAGFYKSYVDMKGNTQYRAVSISFSNMGQERFDKLYDAVADVICRWLGIENETLMDEISELTGTHHNYE